MEPMTSEQTAAERAAEGEREAIDPEADSSETDAAESSDLAAGDLEAAEAEAAARTATGEDTEGDVDGDLARHDGDADYDPDIAAGAGGGRDSADSEASDSTGDDELDQASEIANISNREQTALARMLADGELMPAKPPEKLEWYGDEGPLVVFVHGGYFRPSVDRTYVRPTAQALADLGYRVVLPEYRRVPGDPDVALTDLADLARKLGEPAVWIGHSAGGFMALHRAFDDVDFLGVIALAPVADLTTTAEEHLGEDAVRNWMGATPQEDPETYRRLDPKVLAERRAAAGHPLDADARIFLLHGDLDVSVPVRQTVDFPAAKKVVECAHHFDLIDPESRHWREVCTALGRMVHA